MADKYSDNVIRSIDTDWGNDVTNGNKPFTGRRVQEFIKSTLNAKAGAFRWKSNDQFYVLQGFASNETKQLCIECEQRGDNAEAEKYILFSEELGISKMGVDSYIIELFSDKRSSNIQYVTNYGDDFIVKVEYGAVKFTAATSTSKGIGGAATLIIERSTNNVVWNVVDQMTIMNSDTIDEGSINFELSKNEVNLGKYLLQDTNNYIRMRVSTTYMDNDGVEKPLTSANITYAINCPILSVSIQDHIWSNAIVTPSDNSDMNLTFVVTGGVDKKLIVSIESNDSSIKNIEANIPASTRGNYDLKITDKSLYTTGVKHITAYLTADDGAGGTITSKVSKYQLLFIRYSDIVANAAEVTKKRLLIQNVANEVENFVAANICQYTVCSPTIINNNVSNDIEPVKVEFIINDSSDSVLNSFYTRYYSQEFMVTPGTVYTLSTTLEVESESDIDKYNGFIHVTRTVDGETKDFMYESSNKSFMAFTINNASGFQPTAGSTFVLNPKVRNNTEENAKTIRNERTGKIVESTWEGFRMTDADGWTTDDKGNKVLRVSAGSKLNIKYNPFALFLSNPSASLTMDLDICVNNVINEDDPILTLCEPISEADNTYLGLRMRPLVGTMSSAMANGVETSTDFRWAEGRRVHISINIVPNVDPNVHKDGLMPNDKTSEPMNLVRVFINGVINRELRFDTTRYNEFCTGAMSNGGIIIGQDNADIDIYGIRIWEKRLEPKDVLQNYISTLSTSEEKIRLKDHNDITNESGRIDIRKCQEKGIRTMIWHGFEVYNLVPDPTEGGWLEINNYDYEGNYLPECSGTICKKSKALKPKRQGTTANTYYYSNLQFKISDMTVEKNPIELTRDEFHESIKISEPREVTVKVEDENGQSNNVTKYVVDIYGGNLGKDFPIGTGTKEYSYDKETGKITVPDGWFDGNGKYRGIGFMINEGQPLAQKLVLKINYASSMQSHLPGVNWLYNDLHTAYCGPNSLQKACEAMGTKALVAKHTEPLLFFTMGREDEFNYGDASYRGPGAFGPGKMDKPTWGYSSKIGDGYNKNGVEFKDGHKYFAMFEGANNNTILGDMIAPWDDVEHEYGDGNPKTNPKVYYDPGAEAYLYLKYKDEKSFDTDTCVGFDGGATIEKDGKEYPAETVENVIKNAWNFLYMHSPKINVFNRPYTDFIINQFTNDEKKEKWVCTDGNVRRWDFYENRWVNAGLWNETLHDYDTINVLSHDSSNSLNGDDRLDLAKATQAYIDWIVDEAYREIGNYFNVKSLKFHYCFQNHFIAGTDNCSKNTYYVIDPVTKLIELHQDDVDTVLATDNNGFQTKPYYVDRMHPVADDGTYCYEGRFNVLFNLCEAMWEYHKNPNSSDQNEPYELANALNEIFTKMLSLDGGIENKNVSSTGLFRTIDKYLFNIQRYIPKVAFNEAARIRYEFPASVGFKGRETIDPLMQSMGDQLEAEIQFMQRRLVYMASYAVWGDFLSQQTGTSSTGIEDVRETLGFNTATKNATIDDNIYLDYKYNFELVTHQYMYPCFSFAKSSDASRTRVKPGVPFKYTVTAAYGDNAITVHAINYYRSIGNVGDMIIDHTLPFEVVGKRLIEFTAEPSKYYLTSDGGDKMQPIPAYGENTRPLFGPASLTIGNATRLKKISLKGCTTLTGQIDLRKLSQIESINVENIKSDNIIFPETSTLKTINLGSNIKDISLTNMGGLEEVTLQSTDLIETVSVENCTNTRFNAGRNLLYNIYNVNKIKYLNKIKLTDINWTSELNNFMLWIAKSKETDISGKVALSQAPSFTEVREYVDKFGNIINAENKLYIDYTKIDITTLILNGPKYLPKTDVEYNVWTVSSLNDRGNNVNIKTKTYPNGVTKDILDLKFEFVDDTTNTVWNYVKSLDEDTGAIILRNTYAPDEYLKFKLKVTLNTITDRGITPIESIAEIGFHRRLPKLGDFAYGDGSFDDAYDPSLDFMGFVVQREFDQSTNTWTMWVLAKEDVDGDKDVSYEWGITYRTQNDYNDPGFSKTVLTAVAQALNLSEDQYAFVFDLQDIKNYPSSIVISNNDGNYSSYYLADWLRSGNGQAIGRFESNFIRKYKRNVLGKDITYYGYWTSSDVSPNEKDKYAIFDLETKHNNEAVRSHARDIITYTPAPNGVWPGIGQNYPKTKDDLNKLLTKVVTDAGGDERYRTLCYPAFLACETYEPTDNLYELHDNYKAGNWMLPSTGLLARIYNFYYNSSGRSGRDIFSNTEYTYGFPTWTDNGPYGSGWYIYDGNVVSNFVSDENDNKQIAEVAYPLFSYAFKSIHNVNKNLVIESIFKRFSEGSYLSSTESDYPNINVDGVRRAQHTYTISFNERGDIGSDHLKSNKAKVRAVVPFIFKINEQ